MEMLGPPCNNKMFPESKCCLATLPYQQQNKCRATDTCHFLTRCRLAGENTPTAPCLLCKFYQTGVEPRSQVEEWHMPAFPSTCCSPRGFLECCLLASEELELLSPLPHFLSQRQHAVTISKYLCLSYQPAKDPLDPVTYFINIRKQSPTCFLHSQEYTEFTVRAE